MMQLAPVSKQYYIRHVECKSCGHTWVGLEEGYNSCSVCGSDKLDRPWLLGRIRDSYRAIQEDDSDYKKRRKKILKLYSKVAPVVLDRAKDTYEKVTKKFFDGELSDRVLQRLMFCCLAFHELGLNDNATVCGHMVGSGYCQRGWLRDIKAEDDLADFVRAAQWFAALKDNEWFATANFMLGVKASMVRPVDPDHPEAVWAFLQTSRIHLELARTHYFNERNERMLEYIEKHIGEIIQMFGPSMIAASNVIAAGIQAKATGEAAQKVREGMEYLGVEIRRTGENIRGGLRELSSSVESAGREIASSVDKGASQISSSIDYGMGMLNRSVVQLGSSVRSGLQELGEEIGGSVLRASDKLRASLSGVGKQVTMGILGGQVIGSLITGGALYKTGEIVSSSLGSASKLLGSEIQLAADPGNRIINRAINSGLDKAIELL